MTETTALSIIDIYAEEKHLTRDDLVVTLMKTVMPKDKNGNDLATKADMIGFLQIARRLQLDPWAKEIYCIVSRGRVQPYISIDGYATLVIRQEAYDGCEFDYEQNPDGQFLSVTCSMFRKDRSRPTRVTEFMSECYKPDSDAWKRNPARMLRHRAFIQAARLTFGISAALDEDDGMVDITPVPPSPQIEAPAKPAPKAPAAAKTPPKTSNTQEEGGFRPFADDDAGKQQQRKDGPDEQPAAQQQAEDKPAAKPRQKAPPAAGNGNGNKSDPAGSGHKQPDHPRPDVEVFVNELNDRLNEAKDVDQLREIWVDMNPAQNIMPNEAMLRYAQGIYDKLEAKLKAKG
jgi:hypothetical protein